MLGSVGGLCDGKLSGRILACKGGTTVSAPTTSNEWRCSGLGKGGAICRHAGRDGLWGGMGEWPPRYSGDRPCGGRPPPRQKQVGLGPCPLRGVVLRCA